MLADPSTVQLNLAELSHAKKILSEPSQAGPNPAKCSRDQPNSRWAHPNLAKLIPAEPSDVHPKPA